MSSDNKSEHSEHILPSTMYWGIWALLIVLTFVTAWVANIDLGRFNTVVALIIATIKASVVVLFFMHVKYTSEKLTKVVIISAIFFLVILLTLSMADYGSRLMQ
jgi:cytochrome c oxidase subunit 4